MRREAEKEEESKDITAEQGSRMEGWIPEISFTNRDLSCRNRVDCDQYVYEL